MKSLKVLLFPVIIAIGYSYAKDPVSDDAVKNFVTAIHMGAENCDAIGFNDRFIPLIRKYHNSLTPEEAIVALRETVEDQNAIIRARSKQTRRCDQYADVLTALKIQSYEMSVILDEVPEIKRLTISEARRQLSKDNRRKIFVEGIEKRI
jgi:hypothetical protein